VVDLSRGGEDWRAVLEELEAERAEEHAGRVEAVRATLERIARWTGDTAP
jgi:hypothetical protein